MSRVSKVSKVSSELRLPGIVTPSSSSSPSASSLHSESDATLEMNDVQ